MGSQDDNLQTEEFLSIWSDLTKAGAEGGDIGDVCANMGQDDDERADIRDLCAIIDGYYTERENMKRENMLHDGKATRYFECEVVGMYEEDCPGVTEPQKTAFLSELRGWLDKVMIWASNRLASAVSGQTDDSDTELTQALDALETSKRDLPLSQLKGN